MHIYESFRLEIMIYCIYMNEETNECYLVVLAFVQHSLLDHLYPTVAYNNDRYASTSKAYTRSLGVTCQIPGKVWSPFCSGVLRGTDGPRAGSQHLALLSTFPTPLIRQRPTMVSVWHKLQMSNSIDS